MQVFDVYERYHSSVLCTRIGLHVRCVPFSDTATAAFLALPHCHLHCSQSLLTIEPGAGVRPVPPSVMVGLALEQW